MRTKSDARRRIIMDHATALFCETGYERATMTALAARVGGSKMTLYSYFPSKQQLFFAVMLDKMEAQGAMLESMLGPETTDIRGALIKFGHAYIKLVLSHEIMSITRVGIAEGEHEMGAKMYDEGPRAGWKRIAEGLGNWIELGLLSGAEPKMMAIHLKGLLEAGTFEPALFGAQPAFPVDEAVDGAVTAFLSAYGTARGVGNAASETR